MNTFKTILLLGGLTALLVAIGGVWRHGAYIHLFLLFGLVTNFISYFWSDKIVLRMNNARPLAESEAPQLFDTVRELTSEAGVPMPRLYLIDEAQPNAFATGRNPTHAALAVTSGILRMLDRRQLRGVLAHEIGHIRNRDILIATIAAMLATTIAHIASIARWGMIFGGYGGRDRDDRGNAFGELAMIILAPIAALLIQMAVSRQREFQADETGAKLSRDPNALAAALENIEYGAQRIPNQTVAPATASLYIMNPLFGGVGQGFAKLFSTHPSTAERVRRLRQMATTVQAY